MVQACCVRECTSTSDVPSHAFPKNPEIRQKWLNNIELQPHREKEDINKLRICYKHFSETDYVFTLKYRKLKSSAIPNMSHIVDQSSQKEIEYNRINVQLQEHDKLLQQHQRNIEVLIQQQQQQREDLKITHEKQEKTMTLMQNSIDTLVQQNKQMTKKLDYLKMQINNTNIRSTKHLRCHLMEITRRKNLTPEARRFYDNNIKLQHEKRRLKRVIRRLKLQKLAKRVVSSAGNQNVQNC